MKETSIKLAYFLIIEFLEEKPATSNEILKMLERNNIYVSIKSIQRYLTDITDIFNITYNKIGHRKEVYEIDSTKSTIRNNYYDITKSYFLNSDLLQPLFSNSNLQKHISFDAINSKGLQYANLVLTAIEDSKKLHIFYKDYQKEEEEFITIKPYLLKSYLNRWYVIGSRDKSKKIERFSLEKTNDMQVSDDKFKMPNIDTVKAKFSKIIGVTLYDDNEKLEEVKIKFFDYQFKYFESEPWFPRYVIESNIDNYREVVVSFKVFINNELHQRILFNNVKVQVLEPESLVLTVKEILGETYSYYE